MKLNAYIVWTLLLDEETKIHLREIKSACNSALSKGELCPKLTKVCKFMEVQGRECTRCKNAGTIKEQKYVLPCYCTVCRDCVEKIANELSCPEFEVSDKKPLFVCHGHKVPFSIYRILDVASKVKLGRQAENKLTSFFKRCNE